MYEGNRFADALETVREGVLSGEHGTTEYLRALDTMHEYWDSEVAEHYNRVWDMKHGKMDPTKKVAVLVDAQMGKWLVLDNERWGAFHI